MSGLALTDPARLDGEVAPPTGVVTCGDWMHGWLRTGSGASNAVVRIRSVGC